jgi:signal transduction histidine kinase/ActR/RegA family two-component response regulator
MRADGSLNEGYWNFVYSPLRDASGAVEGILVMGFEVTEQVRAREQVNELRMAAEAASRAKDEFFAILGHELRNPLSPILTALELMRLRGGREYQREREIIERQANHLVRLVDDLLDVSGITRGKIKLKRRVVELGEVVEHAVETALPLLEQRRHDLGVEVGEGLPVEADPDRLAQAIANLLTNAAKYTEPGGRVTVIGERRGHEVIVRVRDTGIGIAPEMEPRIFDVFVQGRQALDRSRGGLGLGLAIVHGIVELHGGAVEVQSEGRGRGSEFSIRLPMAVETPRDAWTDGLGDRPGDRRAQPLSRPERSRGRKILVVDDNEDAASTLAGLLERAGHRVWVAHDGPQALTIARKYAPDVALLDIGLPVMDGYELARRLRELPALERLTTIAVTGYGQASDLKRSRAAGFDAHLVKPVDLAEVEALVRELPASGEP